MLDYGNQSSEMQEYLALGERRVKQLNNRGPIKFDHNGKLDSKIIEDYTKFGFYIFESVYSPDELKEAVRIYNDL